jgi:hypothetical protein
MMHTPENGKQKIIIIIKLQFIVAVNHPHFFFSGKQCSFLFLSIKCSNLYLPVMFDDWRQNKNLNSKVPGSAPINFS